MYPNVKKLSSVGKNGGIASKTVNLKTLSILPVLITESFPVKSTSVIDKANLQSSNLQAI